MTPDLQLSMTTPRTIWWADGKVHMIDQRQLPQTVEIVDFDDVQGIALAINEMVVRGAPAIGAAAAFGMAVAAQGSPVADTATLLADLRQAKTVLDAARPTAVNLSWATSRFLQMAERLAGDGAMVNEIAKALLAEAEAFVAQDIEINQRMGRHGAEVIPQGANILHHCNTGSLATAGYGTALGVVRAAHVAGKHIHVWVDETRPRLQGARLTAWELMLEDIPMHLVVDSASGLLMRQGKVDVVLFGADRVAANGDVANKIGSYNLAILAQEHGIPCYAVVPTSTIDLTLADGDQIPIEERSWLEVATLAGVPVAPNDVLVYNPAFDITPHRYLTGIITEEGICYPPFEQSLKHAKLRAEGRDS